MIAPRAALAAAALAAAASALAGEVGRAAPSRTFVRLAGLDVSPADRELFASYQAALTRAERRDAVEQGSAAPGAEGCALFRPGSDALPAAECATCHPVAFHGNSHPVEVEYRRAQGAPRSGLRPLEEAVRRGALLPEGKVQCASCHDRLSPWKYRLAIPPGAAVRPAVDRQDPRTYEGGPLGSAPLALGAGADIGRKPLCLACHALE